MLSLKKRFLEWAQRPLQPIVLSAAAHVVTHKKDAFNLSLQKRFFCDMKSD